MKQGLTLLQLPARRKTFLSLKVDDNTQRIPHKVLTSKREVDEHGGQRESPVPPHTRGSVSPWTSVSPCREANSKDVALSDACSTSGATYQGLTLVHFSAQTLPFLYTSVTGISQRIHKEYSRQAEMWTSVSPATHTSSAVRLRPDSDDSRSLVSMDSR